MIRRALSSLARRWAIPIAIVMISISSIFYLSLAISGVPTLLCIILTWLILMALGGLSFIVVNIDTSRLIKKAKAGFTGIIKKAVIYKAIAVFISVIIIIALLFNTLLGNFIGADSYWFNSTTPIQRLLNRWFSDEEDDQKWGIYSSLYEDLLNDSTTENTDDSSQVTATSQGQLIADLAIKEADGYAAAGLSGGSKYWDYYSKAFGGSAYSDWCACFVSCILHMSGLQDSVFNGAYSEGAGTLIRMWWGLDGWTFYSSHPNSPMYEANFQPQPGDIIAFRSSSTAGANISGTFDHIGIVAVGIDPSTGNFTTVEGNTGNASGYPYCNYSLCEKKPYHNWTNPGQCGWAEYVVARPPYTGEATSVTPGNTGTSSNIGVVNGEYTKDSEGYYTPEAAERICFDYLRTVMGLSTAAACGLLATFKVESGGFIYDQLEVGLGTQTVNGKTFLSPNTYGNGNYTKGNMASLTEDQIRTQFTQANNFETSGGYGYGINGFSFDWKVSYVYWAEKNGYQGQAWGPDSLLPQLEFIKHTLTGTTHNKETCWLCSGYFPQYVGRDGMWEILMNTPDTADGAYNAGGYWSHYYTGPYGCNRASNHNSFASCATHEGGCVGRANLAVEFYNKYKNITPNDLSGGLGTVNKPVTGGTGDDIPSIKKATLIGDENIYNIYKGNTTVGTANKVLMHKGLSVSNWKTWINTKRGETTNPGRNMKDTITGGSKNDFKYPIVYLGTNDAKTSESEFTKRYTELLTALYKKNTSGTIYVCTLIPISTPTDGSKSVATQSDIDRINGYIKNVVNSFKDGKVVLIDLSKALDTSKLADYIEEDGYSLNTAGGKLVGAEILKYVK